ncbi:MAG: VOC family protein [Gaiellaceae bacterium]
MLANRSMPAGAVIPVLGYDDVSEAADWLCETFGFAERWRAGSHRAQLAMGDSAVAITEGGSPGSNVMVRVDDVDAHYELASKRGVQILDPPTDYPYGERQYTAVDLGGHTWTFSQSIADVAPEDWGGTSGPAI